MTRRRQCPAPAGVGRPGRAGTATLVLAALLLGCTPQPGKAPTTPAVPTLSVTPSSPSAGPMAVGTPGDQSLTLTWWVPDFLASQTAEAGEPPLDGQLPHSARDDMRESQSLTSSLRSGWYPLGIMMGQDGFPLRPLRSAAGQVSASGTAAVRVSVAAKARYGRGGLLDLLRAAQPVAPAILPDLVALDINELPALAATGLLQPLEDVLDPEVLSGSYPFAQQAGQFGGHTLAVPFLTDVEHLVYRQARVPTAPANWAELLASQPISYCLPLGTPQSTAGGTVEEVQRSFISQYLAAGGTLDTETHQVAIDEAPLLRVLTFYDQAARSGVLPARTAAASGLEDCWRVYREDQVAMANVSARRYMVGREGLKNSGYAAALGPSGPATPVASGWALAILARDPARKQAAADLLQWLVNPARLGRWAQAVGWLPAFPAAWASWGEDPYYEFLQAQLTRAVPAALDDPQVAAQVQKAILAVVRDNVTPRDAIRDLATPAPGKARGA